MNVTRLPHLPEWGWLGKEGWLRLAFLLSSTVMTVTPPDPCVCLTCGKTLTRDPEWLDEWYCEDHPDEGIYLSQETGARLMKAIEQVRRGETKLMSWRTIRRRQRWRRLKRLFHRSIM
jgi:hypothetical protein